MIPKFSALLVLLVGFLFSQTTAEAADANVSIAPESPTIDSIVVDGTNLDLSVTVPANTSQVTLEMRPTFNDSWQDVAMYDFSSGLTEAILTTPKPVTSMAFFRLKAEMTPAKNSTPSTNSVSTPLFSKELQYVVVPSLAAHLSPAGDAIFHFHGVIDGSDKIIITTQGALWNHVNWDWPHGIVTINDQQWNPQAKNYVTTTGPIAFLPGAFSLSSAKLRVNYGRDVVALERADHSLIVYLDNTPAGADTYDFDILFPRTIAPPAQPTTSTPATLKIAGYIDGSDTVKITATEATWYHQTYAPPGNVTLNGQPWNPSLNPVLKNAGTNQFLPAGVDLSTARITDRTGRDLATMWSDHDALWVTFADNPDGGDHYELNLSFGQ